MNFEYVASMTTDTMSLTSIVALVGAITSVIAAGVTAWMAVETRRMANAAQRTVELERAPILGVRDLKIGVGLQEGAHPALISIGVSIELFNAGRVPLNYTMRSIAVTFANQTAASAQFLSRGGRILPGSSTLFKHPNFPLNPPVADFPATGRVRCEFEYGEEKGAASQTILATMQFTVGGARIGSPVDWVFVDEQETNEMITQPQKASLPPK